MTVLEQLRKTIEDGHPGETEKLVREALKQHIPAGRIVEEAMTPAMRVFGICFYQCMRNYSTPRCFML